VKNQDLFEATTTALNGLKILAREKAFKRELVLAFLAVAALVVEPNSFAFGLIFIVFLILTLEAVNTAIEKVCDFMQPQMDERIKEIKDLAAAAILILIVLYFISAIAWGLAIAQL
jgi:diacylglycerol kinase